MDVDAPTVTRATCDMGWRGGRTEPQLGTDLETSLLVSAIIVEREEDMCGQAARPIAKLGPIRV